MRALAPLGAWRALLGAYKCPVAPAQRVATRAGWRWGRFFVAPGSAPKPSHTFDHTFGHSPPPP